MTDKKVAIFSTPTCPYCVRAKNYLSQKGIPYVEYNVAADRKAARKMVKRSGQLGVPVIIVGDEVLVGFEPARLDEVLAAKSSAVRAGVVS
jgi:glutaredoxin 3